MNCWRSGFTKRSPSHGISKRWRHVLEFLSQLVLRLTTASNTSKPRASHQLIPQRGQWTIPSPNSKVTKDDFCFSRFVDDKCIINLGSHLLQTWLPTTGPITWAILLWTHLLLLFYKILSTLVWLGPKFISEQILYSKALSPAMIL